MNRTGFAERSASLFCGHARGLGGVLLAGYVNRAYQSTGEPVLVPTLVDVVIAGTSIGGGQGTSCGTIGGVLFITSSGMVWRVRPSRTDAAHVFSNLAKTSKGNASCR